VLFNLYSFDKFHTALPDSKKVPSLNIKNCIFSKFMSGKHEALI